MPIPHLNEFRRQYPTASLRTDLLTLQDSRYVVRAEVWVEGSLLASAMAADAVLETAEDRAYQRVLQCLNPGTEPSAVPEPVLATQAADIAVPGANGAATQSKTPKPKPDSKPEPKPAPSAPVPRLTSLPEVTEEPLLTLPELDRVWADDPSPEPVLEPNEVKTVLPSPTEPPAALPAEPVTAATNPIDLSDIIAQTDVELRRLGWTVGQGREFLEKTYGKRSRHDLTDQELLEFLLYLETQPSPGQS